MTTLRFLILLLCTTVSLHVHANDLTQAADKLCKKMTMCIAEEIGDEEALSPQMKKMASSLAKTACDSFYDIEATVLEASHKKAAIACFNSASTLSCKEIESGLNTKECETFDKMTADKPN